jgi:zinc protease
VNIICRDGRLQVVSVRTGIAGARALVIIGLVLFGSKFLISREYPPEASPPKPVTLPTPAVKILSNGLKVIVIERHSLPVITLRLVVKAGAEADPPDLPGTAQLVASLIDEGTEGRSAQQIAQAIDQIGGSLQTGAEWDDSFGAVTVLSDARALAFDILSDTIIHPSFAPVEIERQRRQTLSALEVMRQDPAYLADTAVSELVFSRTAYSHPSAGTTEAIRRISQADLRHFHGRYYRPANSILAVAGDITASEAFRFAEGFFGPWKTGPQELARAPVLAPRVEPREILVIDKPDAVQSQIRIGNLAVRRDSPEYNTLIVANQILGGPATNRLFKALRSQHGLAYGASSDLLCYQSVGAWVAKTSTRSLETVKALQMMIEQMKRLREHAISRPELDLTQGYLTGHMALDFETTEQIAGRFLEMAIYNLPLDYWQRFPEEVGRVNRDQVAGATREYLDPDHAVIVLVGNAALFDQDLSKLGHVRVISAATVDFTSANLERPANAKSETGSKE